MTSGRFCSACGKQNREQARFCGYCGRPLQAPTPEQSEQQNRARKTTKSLSRTICIVALLGLLAYTNPTVDTYEHFVRQKLAQQSQTPEERAAVLVFGGLATGVILSQTVRTNYIFVSVYDTNIANEHLIALGILNHFIVLATPRPLRTRS